MTIGRKAGLARIGTRRHATGTIEAIAVAGARSANCEDGSDACASCVQQQLPDPLPGQPGAWSSRRCGRAAARNCASCATPVAGESRATDASEKCPKCACAEPTDARTTNAAASTRIRTSGNGRRIDALPVDQRAFAGESMRVTVHAAFLFPVLLP